MSGVATRALDQNCTPMITLLRDPMGRPVRTWFASEVDEVGWLFGSSFLVFSFCDLLFIGSIFCAVCKRSWRPCRWGIESFEETDGCSGYLARLDQMANGIGQGTSRPESRATCKAPVAGRYGFSQETSLRSGHVVESDGSRVLMFVCLYGSSCVFILFFYFVHDEIFFFCQKSYDRTLFIRRSRKRGEKAAGDKDNPFFFDKRPKLHLAKSFKETPNKQFQLDQVFARLSMWLLCSFQSAAHSWVNGNNRRSLLSIFTLYSSAPPLQCSRAIQKALKEHSAICLLQPNSRLVPLYLEGDSL